MKTLLVCSLSLLYFSSVFTMIPSLPSPRLPASSLQHQDIALLFNKLCKEITREEQQADKPFAFLEAFAEGNIEIIPMANKKGKEYYFFKFPHFENELLKNPIMYHCRIEIAATTLGQAYCYKKYYAQNKPFPFPVRSALRLRKFCDFITYQDLRIPYPNLIAQKSKLEKFEKTEPLKRELELIDTILLYCETSAQSTHKSSCEVYDSLRKGIATNRRKLWSACMAKIKDPVAIKTCLQMPLTFNQLKVPVTN